MKKFTLIELIVTIVALGIILSIVLVNFFDIKKKTIQTAMEQNISIIQQEVDSYYIHKNKYPILNEDLLTIESPQFIEIDVLVEEGFQKEKLDTSKIKNQYYWVDVFGKVWGTTEYKNAEIYSLEKKDKTIWLETILNKNYIGYKVYEALGYSSNLNVDRLEIADLNKEKNRYYKVISEFNVELNEDKVVQQQKTYADGVYLFSFVDQYGLETAPMGPNLGTSIISPIIKGEGVYHFEIEGEDLMYWIDYKYLEDKPGKSQINYYFTVKDENGEYSEEYTEDYFSLPPSKGIKVKVEMKADDEGNKPSLYDLRIIFRTDTEKDIIKKPLNPSVNKDEGVELCPLFNVSSDFIDTENDLAIKKVGKLGYYFKTKELEDLSEAMIPTVQLENVSYKVLSKEFYVEDNGIYSLYKTQDTMNKCMFVLYEIEITSIKNQPEPPNEQSTICSEASSFSSNSEHWIYTYSLYLDKNEHLKSIEKPLVNDYMRLYSIIIESSYKGGEFIQHDSINEIKDESCIKVTYKYKKIIGYSPEQPQPPVGEICVGTDCFIESCNTDCVQVCEDCVDKEDVPSENWCELNPENCKEKICIQYKNECVEPVCYENCSAYPPTSPNSNDKEVNDPEWTTVDRLAFFAYGPINEMLYWERTETVDNIIDEENTRIVYRYAKSLGGHWSTEYSDFKETRIAANVMGIAYIQVKTKKKEEVLESDYPSVISMKFIHEKGYSDINMVKPQVMIVMEKDNNKLRQTISTESNIKWDYVASDPRGKKITDVEWAGDKRTKYPVGEYEVKVRVKNERDDWSDWSTVKFKVLEEKPVAKITVSSQTKEFLEKGDSIKFTLKDSYDPDGDKIVNYEWVNLKENYNVGSQQVKLRVQDDEGYWSDWTEFSFVMGEPAYNIYRIEAEDLNQERYVPSLSVDVDKDSNSKPTYVVWGPIGQKSFKFTGTGLDISFTQMTSAMNIIVDIGTTKEKVFSLNNFGAKIYSIRNLEYGEHTFTLKQLYGNTVSIVDYIDVYSPNDKPAVNFEAVRLLYSNLESSTDVDSVVPKLNQQLRVYYELRKDSKVEVFIKNEKGTTVRSISLGERLKGGSVYQHNFIFDVKDDNGNVLENGYYDIQIKATGVLGKEYSVSTKKIFISNSEAAYRVEAETTNKEHVIAISGSTNYHNGANYSKNQGISVWHAGSSMSYQFEGNGFDLSLWYTSQDSYLYVDEGTPNEKVYKLTYDTNRNFVFSVRGLKEGKHTISLKNNVNSQLILLDYIDVYSSKMSSSVVASRANIVGNGYETKGNQFIFSNRLDQTLKLYYKIDRDAKVVYRVLNKNKEVVYEKVEDEYKIGDKTTEYILEFKGLSNDGSKLPSGEYTLEINTTARDKVSKKTNEIKFEIDNRNPDLRIEMENTSSPYYVGVSNVGNYQLVNVDKYSEKKGYHIWHAGSYIVYKVNMTGFDIPFTYTTQSTVIIIDEGTPNEKIYYPTYFANLYGLVSVRGLSKGEHTIKIANLHHNGQLNGMDYIDIYN